MLLELIDFGQTERIILSLEVDLLLEGCVCVVVVSFRLAKRFYLDIVILNFDRVLQFCLV